jgi:signal transduction histidine kinase
MRRSWAIGPSVLYVLGGAGVANATLARWTDRVAESTVARMVSPAVAIAAWATLVALTGGATSPLVAGFWLEIALAPLALGPEAVLVLAGAAIGALWTQQLIVGVRGALEPLCLETCFLLVTGTLTFWASARFARQERVLSADTTALRGRLRALERELQDEQALSRVGERAARVAHAAKGAVHSLRGFTKLIEEPLLGHARHREALEGLRQVIDRLDEIARFALRPSRDETRPAAEGPSFSFGSELCEHAGPDGMSAGEVARTLEEVVREVKPRHSGVRWIADCTDRPLGTTLPAGHLREVLLALLENAVEASEADGEIILQVKVEDGMLRLVVRDRGSGLAPSAGVDLFQLGVTTKPGGSGYGLFLVRRLVESRGGQLTAESTAAGGTVFTVSLPIRDGRDPRETAAFDPGGG